MFNSHLLGLAFVHILPALADVTRGQDSCACGFYDSQTQELFTDSIIVYFNETNQLPGEFIAEDFAQNYAKDWDLNISLKKEQTRKTGSVLCCSMCLRTTC